MHYPEGPDHASLVAACYHCHYRRLRDIRTILRPKRGPKSGFHRDRDRASGCKRLSAGSHHRGL
ncbi:hypothetical protein CHELA40_13654 [Chelatococcus asaccharovorans]|nr:hypothetical protein CHELA40_13654 [Chelatococcus asaccharovorans]